MEEVVYMNKTSKILDIIQRNGGYITTNELAKNNINRYYLSHLTKEGKVKRVSTGYYILEDGFVDNFYVTISKSKKSVFSHASALYFHELTDRNPLVYDITVPYSGGNSYKNEKNVNLHYVKEELLDLGLSEMATPFGMKVRVYDIERTICDIVKNKNKMDSEIFVKAMQQYSKLTSKDLNKLMRYAKKMNIDKKIREYMEVLI